VPLDPLAPLEPAAPPFPDDPPLPLDPLVPVDPAPPADPPFPLVPAVPPPPVPAPPVPAPDDPPAPPLPVVPPAPLAPPLFDPPAPEVPPLLVPPVPPPLPVAPLDPEDPGAPPLPPPLSSFPHPVAAITASDERKITALRQMGTLRIACKAVVRSLAGRGSTFRPSARSTQRCDNPVIMRITVLGAGYMGSAMATVAAKRGHDVRLWGTWLDDEMLDPVERGGLHPRLKLKLDKMRFFRAAGLAEALDGAEIVLHCVNSDGAVPVMQKARGALPNVPILSVTKGFLEGSE
jgi:hypothetical protein